MMITLKQKKSLSNTKRMSLLNKYIVNFMQPHLCHADVYFSYIFYYYYTHM